MINPEPFDRLLDAIVATGDTVDWLTQTGQDSVTARHGRNRYADEEEKPCVSVVFVGDEPAGDDLDHNAWETVRELQIDLVVDAALDPEDGNLDPTGYRRLSRIAAAFIKAMRTPGSPIDLLSDWVRQAGIAPDDRSTSDQGRLVSSVIVVYRVRTDDENVLLAQGVMG